MRISPVASKCLYGLQNCKKSINKNTNLNSVRVDSNKKNNQYQNITFGAYPWILKQPSSFNLTAKEGIRLFEKLKLGNYLDIDGDSSKTEPKEMRAKNLQFLDKISDEKEQRKFIEYYEKLTGFPDMKAVCKNIKKEFIRACCEAEEVCKKSDYYNKEYYEIVSAGYDGVSSVSNGTALPGSDLDKAYIILRGCDSDSENEKIVANYKAELWKNTDQRVLSYNHDADSFPKVYTLKQITSVLDAINEKAKEMKLDERVQLPFNTMWEKLFAEPKFKTKRPDFEVLTEEFSQDYIKVNEFFIELAKKFDSVGSWDKPLNTKNPSREDVYRASYILEAMLKGEVLVGERVLKGKDTSTLELINLSQIGAIKKSNPMKPKHILRQNLSETFNQWDTNTQYAFIKELIKASSSDQTEFLEYFSSDTAKKFDVLLKEVDVGDK